MTPTQERLQTILSTIADAAKSAGRQAKDIRLIGVSKGHSLATIQELVDAGLNCFGENRIQEALPKIETLAPHNLEWHFLGPIQRNKVRFLPGHFSWIHSLASQMIADSLSRHAVVNGHAIRALLEINITGDPAKHGLAADGLRPFLDHYCRAPLPGITLCGLMTIGPYTEDTHAIAQTFAHLRKNAELCRQHYDLPFFNELSMGMSGDFSIAIREGATMVRIGGALFGAR